MDWGLDGSVANFGKLLECISLFKITRYSSDEDMQSVPRAHFKYLRETFRDTAFRASQFLRVNFLKGKTKAIKSYHCGSQVKGPHLTLGDPPFYS